MDIKILPKTVAKDIKLQVLTTKTTHGVEPNYRRIWQKGCLKALKEVVDYESVISLDRFVDFSQMILRVPEVRRRVIQYLFHPRNPRTRVSHVRMKFYPHSAKFGVCLFTGIRPCALGLAARSSLWGSR